MPKHENGLPKYGLRLEGVIDYCEFLKAFGILSCGLISYKK
jgi:hypothetical protein